MWTWERERGVNLIQRRKRMRKSRRRRTKRTRRKR